MPDFADPRLFDDVAATPAGPKAGATEGHS